MKLLNRFPLNRPCGLRRALASLALLTLTAPAIAADPGIAYTQLKRCPYSAAELSTATGLKVELVTMPEIAGAPKPMTEPRDGQMFLSCSATDGAVSASLLITQRWFSPKGAGPRIQAIRLRDLKNAQAVDKDPDGALWLSERQGAKQSLHYVRSGNLLVSISINGVPAAQQAELRTKLLALRRLP